MVLITGRAPATWDIAQRGFWCENQRLPMTNLVAILTEINGFTTCTAGPKDFAPPRCSLVDGGKCLRGPKDSSVE
jgi:hypothetical protein